MKNTPSTIVNKIVIPNKFGNRQKSEELLNSLKSISDEDIQRIGEEMEKAREIRLQRENEGKRRVVKLMGDTDAILKDLKENHVRIEENAEITGYKGKMAYMMMGYKGKKVYIDLPAVGNFEGFKFDCFMSDGYIMKRDYEYISELVEKSYSMSDISNLLQAMNKYMLELHGKNDGDMDYENELRYGETDTFRCNSGDCLKRIIGLDGRFWLSDKNVFGKNNSRAGWNLDDDNCFFDWDNADGSSSGLLLKLSD